jgi:prepilin-type N-terminal cleavage/methylation domain-containing protein
MHKIGQHSGFTLAELLIALAILGELATFTIPKILSAQQHGQNITAAKETIAMVAGAYQAARLAGVVSTTTKASDLSPYMNYVSLDSTTVIDGSPTVASYTCTNGGGNPCIRLHNGSILMFRDAGGMGFGGTATTNGIVFMFDPNGKQDIATTADGPGKSIRFVLYYDGGITTVGNVRPNSCWTGGGAPVCGNYPDATLDPSWFSW